MAKPKADAGSSDGPLDFEQSMKRLETIVEELEAGELSLEDSIARYEEGIKLSRRLTTVLDESEKRIERLVERAGEAPTTEPMELTGGRTSSGSEEPPSGNRPAATQDELPF